MGKRRLVYVIHEHAASRLHYDLRLEMKGVLKSWALPKAPPKAPGLKRLAVAVEDHSLGYEKFKGVIPEGRYGAGTVNIWDKGYYEPVETGEKRMLIDIHGKKLRGRFALIKFTPENGSKNKNWLFFKKNI